MTHDDVADALRSFVAGPVADRLVEAGGQLPEERRLITALFADVSGFTALAERLDPEQLLEVIDPVIARLSSIVGRHEGYVEKFAGDALLALFGAPVSHEDDAARALRVALEMHRELARVCAELPYKPELTLHVGVNSGHGIARILGSEARTDYAVLGDSVILAQRLESSAPPGETYVSGTTVRLTEDLFEFEPIGMLTLKGKAEPVPAWRLLAERRETTRAQAPLIGRETELATILEALAALDAGHGVAVTVTGEPGVGKSRLTSALRERMEERGARWLHARCLSYGTGIAYWPYADLVRRWAGIRPDAGPADAAASLAGALDRVGASQALPFFGRLVGITVAGAEEAGHLEPEAFRRALHQAFTDWLRTLAETGPVVLALEDVHWADGSSVALTAELAAACSESAVGLYLIARPEAAPALLEVAPDAVVVELASLGADEVERLMASVLGSRPPEGLSTFVTRRTGGNPLFVEELVRSLLDTGTIVRDDGRLEMRPGWDARTLPATIEEVLSARIDLLPRPAAETLQVAAVIGRRVPLRILRGVAPRDALERDIDELVARGFLERAAADGDEVVVFHHALVQDAAYDRLLRRKRRELHLRVAEVAEELYGAGDDTIDLLARHRYLGGSSDAVDYLRRAGERAKRLFANEEAILHLSRAAELAPADAGISLALADLYELVGLYEDALRLYEQVREQEPGKVDAWRGLAATLRKRGEYERALATVDEAFRTAQLARADLTPLWSEQGRTLEVSGRVAEAVDVLQAGLAAAGARRDAVVGQLLFQLSRALTLQGAFEAALEHALAAKAIFAEHEDLRGLASTMRVLGDTYRYLGRLDDAAAALREGLQLAERVGNVEEIGGCLINLGIVEASRGALLDARASFERSIEEFERIGHGGRATAYANLAYLLVLTGEFGDALAAAEQAVMLAREMGRTYTIASAYDTIAWVALKQGRYEEAVARAEDAAALHVELGALPDARKALELAGEALEKAGEEERARELRERARLLAVSEPVS